MCLIKHFIHFFLNQQLNFIPPVQSHEVELQSHWLSSAADRDKYTTN